MGQWRDLNINYIDTSITTRISNLEDQYELIQYYQTISGGTSGTVTIPTGYIPDLDRFGNGLDAIITKQGTDSRPFDQVVNTATGAIVTTTFNLAGEYVLSDIPTSYPICIVFYLKGQRKYSNNLVYNNILDISTVQLSNSYTGTAQNVAVTEKALSDGLASIGSSEDARLTNDRAITQEPTGFDRSDLVEISYDSTTRKITLSGAGWKAYYKGTEIPILTNGYVSAAHDDIIDNTFFLYHNGTSIQWMQNGFPGFNNILIAVVKYRTDAKFGMRECHGLQQWQSHQTDHLNIGTYRESGGDVTGITLLSNTALERRPDISACTIWDEDCPTINSSLISKLYTQRFISSANTINYLFAQGDIVSLSGNNPYYNQNSNGTYVQTLMPANSMMTIWVYELPVTKDSDSQRVRRSFIQGQSITQATNPSAGALTTAYNLEAAKTTLELNIGDPDVISAEYVCIHKFILQYTGGNWSIRGSIKVTGSRANQVGTAVGNYLTEVVTDATLTGNGTAASPLSVVKNIVTSTVTFNNESNYEEVTITDASILPTSNIFPHLEDSEEVAIQSIICGLKSKTTGSCEVFAGTPHGATGTYNLTVQIIN